MTHGDPTGSLTEPSKGPEELPQANGGPVAFPNPTFALSPEQRGEWSSTKQRTTEEEVSPALLPQVRCDESQSCSDEARDQELLTVLLPHDLPAASSFPAMGLTIDQAIKAFLQDQHAQAWEPKTLEWHQTSLKQLQSYLAWRGLILLSSLTGSEIRGWLTFLRTESLMTGAFRVNNTISTYARSVHAFCSWLALQGYLEQTPFASERQ
jgi:hypothetical protein